MNLFIITYLILLALVFIKAFDTLILENSLQNSFRNNQVFSTGSNQPKGVWLIASLGLLAFAIPYYRVSTSIPSILLGIGLVYTWIKSSKGNAVKGIISKEIKVYFTLILAYFIFLVIHSVLFNGDFQKLQLNLLLPFYFLAFLFLQKLSPHHFVSIAKFYILGALCFIPFVLVIAAFHYDSTGWNTFYYTELLSSLKANPITHSFYYNIAIILVAKFIKDSKSSIEKIGYILSIFAFVFMLLLFGSKTGYLTCCLSLIFIGLSLIRSKVKKAVFISVILFAMLANFAYVPYINKKVNGFKWQITKHEKIILAHRLPRTVIWPQALSLIKENPIKGVGLGRSADALSAKYHAIDYTKGINYHFNVHNQFLESWLQLGFFGIFWWILLIAYIAYLCIRRNAIFLGHFLFLLISYLLVESLFETQMGMVGVAFFSAYFIINTENNSQLK